MPIIINPALGTPLTEFYKDVLPECPGLMPDFALHHIRNAAIEFCSRTWAWQYELADTMVIAPAALTDYALTVPADSEPIAVLWVKAEPEVGAEQKEIRKAAYRDVQMAPSTTGAPTAYTLASPDTLRLYPTPDDGYDFTVQTVIRPTRTATMLGDDIFSKYRMEIAHGALFRLMAMANKPWSSPSTAAYHGTEFSRGVRDAKIELNRDFTGEPLMIDLTLGNFA